MGARSKGAKVRSAARERATKPTRARTRTAATTLEFWEQTAQVPDERDDETDCQRIVQGDGSRSLPTFYDDYN
jgi:hypothetical protein